MKEEWPRGKQQFIGNLIVEISRPILLSTLIGIDDEVDDTTKGRRES